jgi:hypothetical protein
MLTIIVSSEANSSRISVDSLPLNAIQAASRSQPMATIQHTVSTVALTMEQGLRTSQMTGSRGDLVRLPREVLLVLLPEED